MDADKTLELNVFVLNMVPIVCSIEHHMTNLETPMVGEGVVEEVEAVPRHVHLIHLHSNVPVNKCLRVSNYVI